MSFDLAFRFTLGEEGGKVDNPNDRGKRTAYGITQGTYQAWTYPSVHDVWLITPRDVYEIKRKWYWGPVWGERCCGVDPRLSLLLYDAGINHGPSKSVKWLQITLNRGLAIDGGFGPRTLAAVQNAWASGEGPAILTGMLAARRLFFYNLASRDSSQKEFLNGWLRRCGRLEEVIEQPVEQFASQCAKVQKALPRGFPWPLR